MGERKIDWEALETAYRTTSDSVRRIARDFGVTESAVRDRAKRYNWVRGEPAQTAQPALPEPRTCAPAQTERQDDGLTEKQRQFVREYLVDLNATAAAKRAGYSEDSAYSIGHENLSKPEIAAAIQRAMDERAGRTEVTADRVLSELADMAFYDPAAIAGADIKGPADIVKLPENVRRAIIGWNWDKQGRFTLKLSPKTPSLDLIGKHLGMFVNRTEITGDAGGPVRTETTFDFSELTKEERDALRPILERRARESGGSS